MTKGKCFALTALAMIAFAGNSLLCRQALKHTTIDAATFTLVRILSGALCLWIIVLTRKGSLAKVGSWPSALALFGYAGLFSFAYLQLTAGTGALLLFGAGIAWGIYSLRGKNAGDPLRATAGNFLRAVPMAALLSVVALRSANFDRAGIVYAIISGALASGVGYAIWYSALPALKASAAATVQLSVPVLAAAGGIVFLGETITLRFALASIAVLGGIALVIVERRAAR